MAQVVVTDSNGDVPAVGSIFDGLSFFLVQRVPFRSSYIAKIEANGGRVVKFEQQADHIVADHLRRDCPPGSVSYTFIDTALKDGSLPDPADHVAGVPVGMVREVGSTSLPARTTRTPFTADDERVLWQWVEHAKASGGMVKGNEIYKQLELRNPRHTFQAWRDHYIKRLMHKPPAGAMVTVAANPPPTPPVASDQEEERRAARAGKRKAGDSETRMANSPENKKVRISTSPAPAVEAEVVAFADFGEEEFDKLWEQADDIVDIDPENIEAAWTAWAQAGIVTTPHTPEEWRAFWERKVFPEYMKMRRKVKQKRNSKMCKEAVTEREVASPVSRKSQEHGTTIDEESTPRHFPSTTQIGSPSLQVNRRQMQEVNKEGSPERENVTRGVRLSQARKDEDEDEELSEDEVNMQQGESGTSSPTSNRQKSSEAIESSNDDEFNEDEDESYGNGNEMDDRVKTQRPTDLSISGANWVVDQQEHQESGEGEKTDNSEMNLSSSHISTSDANRAAEAQLGRESLDQDKYAFELEKGDTGDVTISTHLFEDGEFEDGFPGEKVFEADQSGAPLTEANLATQQAQQKTPSCRAADLPEDDREKDQSSYLSYLQAVTGGMQNQTVSTLKVGTTVQQLPLDPRQDGSDVSEEENEGDERNASTHEFSNIAKLPPGSSNQEVDEMLEWPSPSHNQILPRKVFHSQTQSQPFETQIAYPMLPVQEDDKDNEEIFTTQPIIPPSIEYPAQPNQVVAIGENEFGTGLFFSSDLETADLDDWNDRSRRYMGVKLGVERRLGKDDEFQSNDLDLDLAEPEGGFELSSPEKSTASHVYLKKHQQGYGPGIRGKHHSRPNVEQLTTSLEGRAHAEAAEGQDAIELSTAPSSSSPYQSTKNSPSFATGPETENERTLNTQEIVDAETQVPDFAMPLPSESDEENAEQRSAIPITTRLSSARLSQQSDLMPTLKKTAGETLAASALKQPNYKLASPLELPQVQQMDGEDIESFITSVAVKHNIMDTAAILAALKATSARQELALIVLLEQKAARMLEGAPGQHRTKATDLPGVWTEDEDRAVESGDARSLRKITEKHGWDECLARMEFLTMWRQSEM